MPTVFISGATGYLGRPLCQALLSLGWDVHALTRPQSIRKVPIGCTPVPGDALAASTFQNNVPTGATVIHLTGVAHPSPAKAAAFRAVDQVSFEASLQAAQSAGARHFIYVSVAHPAPVMHEYIAVRRACEDRLQRSALNATILRPWYITGPGHRWPYVLLPFYKLAEQIPQWRSGALRLGLVTHQQMLAALVAAAGQPAAGVRILDVPAIRESASASPSVLSHSYRRSPTLSA